ncbi:hypothetical protein [Leifsonia sp. LS-T14]|uniref:hypothetical protein n=1 Tax=unclassified Leifsonia TaxID=2663824 RepID=UPI0035A70B33
MRVTSVLRIVRFLLVFIVRRVLGRGLLASRTARFVVIAAVAAAFAGYCVLSVVVLRQVFGGSGFVEPILRTASISTLFWLAVAYTIVRVLFFKADELLQLSYSLPVTNRERALALTLFEAAIVLVALVAAFGGLAAASLVLLGADALGPLVTGILMPAITLYLFVSVGYLLTERILLAVGLSRLRGLIIPGLLAGFLVVSYAVVSRQSEAFLTAYLAGEQLWLPQLVYSWLAGSVGILPTAAVFLLSCAILIVVVLFVTPRSYVPLKCHFSLLPSRLADRRFGAHLLVAVRSFETGVVILLTVVVTFLLWFYRVDIPPYALLLVTFQGVYAFSNSEPLRRIGIAHPAPAYEYLCLIGAQSVLLAVVSVPSIALSTTTGIDLGTSLSIVGLGLSNICMTTLVGVAFPPERGNPFSVLVGLVLLVVVAGTLLIGINLFALPGFVTAIALAVLALVTAAYSVYGISRIEKNRRHAHEVVA